MAGDVFDHANPSAASQRQLFGFLTEARRLYPELNIVLVSGNHDSPARFEAPSPLLAGFNITVVGQVMRDRSGSIDLERLVVPLKDLVVIRAGVWRSPSCDRRTCRQLKRQLGGREAAGGHIPQAWGDSIRMPWPRSSRVGRTARVLLR